MYPMLQKIRIKYPYAPPCSVHDEMQRSVLGLKHLVGRGSRVCIAVGSRGINNIGTIVAMTVEAIKSWGGNPFILPAMGSHGGAKVEGQKKILENYGITELSMGAPVESSMDVRVVGYINGTPIYTSVMALESDAVILINRIKPHTDFTGEIESGLVKMAVVGLGNDTGAQEIHKQGFKQLPELILSAGRMVFNCLANLGGIAVLENYYGETFKIIALTKDQIEEREKGLLIEAKIMTPRLPFDYADILLVDYMGKDISGCGIDTKVVGRTLYSGIDQKPEIKILAALDITAVSEGNAIGIGLADLTTKKLVKKIDFQKTYLNCMVSQGIRVGKIPITLENDKNLIDTAMHYCGESDPTKFKLARIRSTLHIDELYVTDALLLSLNIDNEHDYDVEKKCPITFTKEGDLFTF